MCNVVINQKLQHVISGVLSKLNVNCHVRSSLFSEINNLKLLVRVLRNYVAKITHTNISYWKSSLLNLARLFKDNGPEES